MAQPLRFVPEKLSENAFKFRVFTESKQGEEGDSKPSPIMWQDFWSVIHSDSRARSQLNELLAGSPFPAFFFECPPLTPARLTSMQAEFVLVDSPRLATVTADSKPFRKEIASGERTDGVAVFANLGKDATLVVPCQNAPEAAYAHIAKFTREAPAAQRDTFWKSTAQAVQRHLSSPQSPIPLWVSTSGLGVYWLHLRLDSVPKYYSYQPYKAPPKEEARLD